MVDTPTLPRGVQGGAKCFSPILSHTLTAVNRLFFMPSNYYLTVLDFVCFVMHFYQLLHTFTVNKHKSR